MAIGATGLTGANDNTDASSYVTPSISPAADSLLLVFYGSSISSGVAPTVTVSGLGLTWTDQDNVAFSSTGVRRVGVATAQCGSSPGSGALTLTMSVGASGCWYSVIEITGHNTGAPVVQTVTNSGSGSASDATLAAAGAADNRPFFGTAVRVNAAITPRTNWTEVHDNPGSAPSMGYESQWRSDTFETACSATWSGSGNWGCVAVEIAAATGGSPQDISPSGLSSAEAFGSATVSPGAVDVAPGGIASTEAIGAAVLTTGAVDVAPSGIASAEAFGSHTVALDTTQNVSPTGITSAEAIGSATLTTGSVDVAPSGIASAEAFGSATVATTGQIIAPEPIYAPTENFGTPTVLLNQDVAPAGIESAEAFGQVAVTQVVYIATTPYELEPPAALERPYRRVELRRGVTYYKKDGVWYADRLVLDDSDLDADVIYRGGYEYLVNASDVAELEVQGFTVRQEIR